MSAALESRRRDNVSIRPATAADLARLREIYAGHVLTGAASFEEEPPALEEFKRRWQAIADLGLPYLVACDPQGPLGYAYAGPYRPRSAYRFSVEDSIYLDPSATGRGIGARLLQAVIGDSANTGSIALHRRLGFADVGPSARSASSSTAGSTAC